jgi:hypothetical protein
LERSDSSAVGQGWAGYHNRPKYDQQHWYHHAPKVKPEVATAIVERGDSSAVGHGRAGYDNRSEHDQQHCYHHAPKVKPEAATAVVKLLMMGVRTLKPCLAVNKRQVINWRNCCI